MFRALCSHRQEVKIVFTASGIVTLCRWPSGAQVERGAPLNLRTGRPPTESDDTRCCIIQFDLLMMNTWCSKHVEAYNKVIIKQEYVH